MILPKEAKDALKALETINSELAAMKVTMRSMSNDILLQGQLILEVKEELKNLKSMIAVGGNSNVG